MCYKDPTEAKLKFATAAIQVHQWKLKNKQANVNYLVLELKTELELFYSNGWSTRNSPAAGMSVYK